MFPNKMSMPLLSLKEIPRVTSSTKILILFGTYYVSNILLKLFSSFLSMTPVWNSGISFGFFQNSGEIGRYGFTIFAFIVSIWLMYSSFKLPRYSSLGFILIASGAIGNAIDRIIYGKVVDFIDFHIEDLHWPAFNLADTIIFIGATLFLYNQFFTIERTYYEN